MPSEQSSASGPSPAKKLESVEDIWSELAATPSDVPVTDWQKAEVERRKADLLRNPGSALSWDKVKRRILSPNLVATTGCADAFCLKRG